ncbi:hypothetical protein U9M48_012247 [Paspalum notatum var. saurae]|uniref:F-box associated beta-propeller type 3 domain-containing protein n=1 Tax=Paspalum notatum var. saurae TaxID=547442 RepID=A0AAQ3WIC8_PASNO
MASPKLLAQDKDGNLPRDAPSKPLARPRTISYPWRSLLAVAAYPADASRVDVRLLDMASGAVVAQLDAGQSNGRLFGMSGGLLCSVSGATGNAAVIRVLDPATGAMTGVATIGTSTTAGATPTSLTYVFGQVPKTGEHKVLRIYTSGHNQQQQSCEILTLLCGGGWEQSWRPAASPPVLVDAKNSRHRAVTHGVVHFMTPDSAEYDGIVSFDLATEKWKPALLRNPAASEGFRHCLRSCLSLVDLNGCLVSVCPDYRSKSIDMWVLADLGMGTWLRIQALRQESVLQTGELMAQPLTVADDGRIALWVAAPNGAVRVYDPKTAPAPVVAAHFCAPYVVQLTVKEKVMSLREGDFTITDANGAVVIRVKGSILSIHNNRLILDANGNPLLTLREKVFSMHNTWEVYKGDSSKQSDLLFIAKKSSILQPFKTEMNIYLASNTSHEVCDFKMKGSFKERACSFYLGDSNTLIAQCTPSGSADAPSAQCLKRVVGSRQLRVPKKPRLLDPTEAISIGPLSGTVALDIDVPIVRASSPEDKTMDDRHTRDG